MDPRLGHTARTRDTVHHPGKYQWRTGQEEKEIELSGSAQRRSDRVREGCDGVNTKLDVRMRLFKVEGYYSDA